MSEKDGIVNNSQKLQERIGNEEKTIEETTEVIQDILLRDSSRAVEISRRFLITLGIWHSDEPGKLFWRFVLTNISVLACYFGLGMCIVPTGLFIATEMRDPIGKVKLIGPWLFCVAAALKYRFLQSHRRDIDQCMKHIKLDWLRIESSSSRHIMIDHARHGKLITMICAAFTYTGGLFFALLPLVMEQGASSDASDNVTLPRALSLPSSFVIFDPSKTPMYEIIYAVQVAAAFMMHSITIASYSLAVVIVTHACGQLKILMEMLNELVDETGGNLTYGSVDSKMSNIINHHVRALGFVSVSEKMLREICLVELGTYTVNLCLVGYFILLEWASENKDAIALMTWITLFFSFMFNLFSFCYIGELLTGECKKVGETTYMIDWYRLPGKQSLGLGLTIAMSRKPVTLTAGGAMQLSFACFASVVKTSVGYLNMLRTVMP